MLFKLHPTKTTVEQRSQLKICKCEEAKLYIFDHVDGDDLFSSFLESPTES